MFTYADTPAYGHATAIADSGLILDNDLQRVEDALRDCVRGERCPAWLVDETGTAPLARITLSISLWYAGQISKVRTYEFAPRASDGTWGFGPRVLETIHTLIAPYLGRINLVTIDVDAYTQAELDVIAGIAETL